MNTQTRRRNVPLLLLLLAGLVLLPGCGGGGGGGSSSGPQIVTITGHVQDKTQGTPLISRTVAVQGTSLSGVTNSTGDFSIAGVTVGSVTLTFTDSGGTSNGTYPIDLSKFSGNPRSVGTIALSVSNGTGGPPGLPTGF